jgi:hypothetical protein
MPLSSRLALAAGLLLGAGHRDSHAAVLEALDLWNAAGNDVEQHMQAIGVHVHLDPNFDAKARKAVESALISSFLAGQQAQRDRVAQLKRELDEERARLDHIEAHWFDQHGADPAKGEPEGFEWAFDERWEYVGTQSLRVAVDNEIELHRANPADETPTGEPVITDADRLFMAKLPPEGWQDAGEAYDEQQARLAERNALERGEA